MVQCTYNLSFQNHGICGAGQRDLGLTVLLILVSRDGTGVLHCFTTLSAACSWSVP